MADEQRRTGFGGIGGIGDGIRTGIGILNAFREAVEETLDGAVQRGELTPERARQTMREAFDRVQESFDGARERLDLVPRAEMDELRNELAQLRERVARLEAAGPPGPPPPGLLITE